MSLSRMSLQTGRARTFILPLQLVRFSSQNAPVSADSEFAEFGLRPEEKENPGFFQKIILRFKGIPLKGEVKRPRAMFEDLDKEFFPLKALPEMPKDFKENPSRDVVNYPYPTNRMYPPKTRMLVIPDSWMTPFQKVTGVSGPYLFFGGLAMFLVNKEIFVIDQNAYMIPGWIALYFLLTRTVSFRLDKWLYGKYQARVDHYKELIDQELQTARDFRKNSAAEEASLKAAKEHFPMVFKENMEMQLEAAYRFNIQQVSKEMKRRIDYLREVEQSKERFEREHMLNWITDGVRAEIAANKEGVKDQYMNKCIEHLKTLSAQA